MQVRKTRLGGQPGGLGHPVRHVSTSKAHRPVFDKKELNKIFKGEHSAVSRNRQLKIFCGKPGSEERALDRAGGGRVVSQAVPSWLRAEKSGAHPLDSTLALGLAGTYRLDCSRKRILLSDLCLERIGSTRLPKPAISPSLPSLVFRKPSLCPHIAPALLPGLGAESELVSSPLGGSGQMGTQQSGRAGGS